MSVPANAQVPGYLGRRWITGLDFQFAPRTSWRFDSKQQISKSWYLAPEANLGLAVSRSQLIGLGVCGFSSFGPEVEFGEDSYPQIINPDSVELGIRGLRFNFSSKTFPFRRGGKIAPIGSYFHFFFGLGVFKGLLPNADPSTIRKYEGACYAPSFGLGWGRNTQLNDFLALNAGFDFDMFTAMAFGNPALLRPVTDINLSQVIRFKVGLYFLYGGGKWR
jgi:hypothetical protein